MPSIFLVLIAFFCLAVAQQEPKVQEPFLTEELVSQVNHHAGGKWKASLDQGSFFQGATFRQLKALMGVVTNEESQKIHNMMKRSYKHIEIDLPENFEAAFKWPNCPSITTIRDQSACGSCWAFGAAEAISDRYCTYGIVNISISANNLLACCTECGDGCKGGNPPVAWQHWVNNGLVDDLCDPYPFPKCEHHVPAGRYPKCPTTLYPTPACQMECKSPGRSWSQRLKYGTSSWTLSGEEDFKKELFMNGPFEVGMDVYSDIVTYKSGVYSHSYGRYLGGHAVRVVGWGTLNGQKYWKIANSWNPDWGLNGYFLIARGTNECNIESSGSAGSPRLERK